MIIASDGVWDAMSAEAALVCCRGLPPDTAAAQIVKVRLQTHYYYFLYSGIKKYHYLIIS